MRCDKPVLERCGIILAAGEGKRLQPLIRQLRGDTLPKQYVNFVGARSMLQHTFRRAEMLIPPERLFTVVSQHHLEYPEALRQLLSRPQETVILQPENKETGPGLLLPLMHLYKRFSESAVAIFPADHFVLEEELFMAYVDLAFRVVEQRPSSLVLLGIEPDWPETEYGYILPGDYLPTLGVRKVLGFREKPQRNVAEELIARGSLWNTMVMVFKPKTLLDFIRVVASHLYRSFETILRVIGSPTEADAVAEIYRRMETVNFSRGVLEMISPGQSLSLLVVPVRGVLWSDWGTEARIMRVLARLRKGDPLRILESQETLFERSEGNRSKVDVG